MSYPLPRITADILARNAALISNLGLYLTRYTDREGDQWEVSKAEKKLPRVQAIMQQNSRLLQDYTQRWAADLAATSGVHQFTAIAQSRCVVGLGAKGTHEVGLALHPIYGFPIIPGSGLKGLTRTFATLTAATALADELGLKIKNVLDIYAKDRQALETYKAHIQRVTDAMIAVNRCCGIVAVRRSDSDERQGVVQHDGKQDGAGTICFFDAVPDGEVKLDIDIMNPHHRAYYDKHGEGTPPADYESPVPVYFLTVAAGTRFRFAVAPRWANHPDAEKYMLKVVEWLQGGLTELGVGGKTTSGYGMFGGFDPPCE